jgi:hypothetical protein
MKKTAFVLFPILESVSAPFSYGRLIGSSGNEDPADPVDEKQISCIGEDTKMVQIS